MDIDIARIFCDLAELQSFSRAADKHGISQSAVSQQLAQLEIRHKCQLIDRRKRPLAMTAAGELFYRACREIIERYERLTSDMAAISKSRNRLNIAAIFSIGMHTLQPYVKRFMEISPDVNLNVEYYSADAIYEKVLNGQVDIGIVAVPRMDRSMEVYPFENEPLMLACSPDNSLARETIVDIHRLDGQKFIAFGKDVPTRILIDGILSQYGINVRTVMEFDNVETIKRAVEINTGVSILPRPTVRSEAANGTIRIVPFSNRNFYRPTGIIIRKNKTMSPAGKYFIELLQKKMIGRNDED